jgi:phospholipid/cholesterol/gamma-HCH transport system substrate-binding protein
MLFKDLTYQVKVGIVVLAGVVLGIVAYMSLLAINRPSGYSVTVEFENARGIKKGTSVQRAGTDVGWISAIGLDSERGIAVANVRIAPGVVFPKDAKFLIMSEGLIEEKYIAIKDNPEPNPLAGDAEEGDVFIGTPDPGLTDMITNANLALVKVNTLLGTFDDMMSEEKLGGVINEVSKNLNDTLRAANSLVGRADRMLAMNEKNISGTMANAYLVSKDVTAMTGDIKNTMDTLDLGNRVDSILTQVDKLLVQVNQVTADMSVVTSDPEVRGNVKDSIAMTKTTLAEAQETLRTLRGTLDRVNEKLDKIGPISFKGKVNVRNESTHNNDNSDMAYVDVKTRLRVGDKALDVGVENIGDKSKDKASVNFQGGQYVSESLLLRGGIFRSEFGMGFDYSTGKGMKVAGDLYDINDPKVNSYLSVPVGKGYDVLLGVEDIGDQNQLNAGVSLSF